jgi:hypothetical protein
MTLRLIDVLCDNHISNIVDTGIWPAGFEAYQCDDCVRVHGHLPPQRVQPITPGADLPSISAHHEAGHAVVHMLYGAEVVEVMLPDTCTTDGGGTTHLSVPKRLAGSAGYLAGTWAGSEAAIHYLDQVGLLDRAARIDVANTSVGDIADIRQHVTNPLVLETTRAMAIRLVAEHWSAIERVADALLDHGRLTGDEIAQIAGLGCGATA